MKTKGAIVLLISLMFVVVSCEGIGIKEDALMDTAIKAGTRQATYEAVKKYPAAKPDLTKFSKLALEALDKETLDIKTNLLEISGALEKIEDPALRAALKDAMSIIEIGVKEPELDPSQRKLLEAVLIGINEGATMPSE